MTVRSSDFLTNGSAVGDLKAVYGGVGVFVPTALQQANGQHWLRAGSYLAYSATYSALLGVRDELLRTQWRREFAVAAPTQAAVAYDGTRYISLGRVSGSVPFGYKTSLTGALDATAGPSTGSNSAGIVRIASGASAGRLVALDTTTTPKHMAAATTGSWTNSGGGLTRNDLTFLATKPDGSLLTALPATVGSSAGDIATSADAGATWTNRTPSGIAAGAVSFARWSPLLAAFLLGTATSVQTSTDGFTGTDISAQLGGTHTLSTVIGETATAVVYFRTDTGILYRSTGGAFASIGAAPATFTGMVGSGADLYATDGRRVYKSTDNGSTWVAHLWSPVGDGMSTLGALAVANGVLFGLSSSQWMVIGAAALPESVTAPDLVGIEALGSPLNVYTHVRIR